VILDGEILDSLVLDRANIRQS